MSKTTLLLKKSLTALILTGVAIFGPVFGYAQSVTVSGTVKAADGEMLPGVSVIEKGTSNGTVTDIDGAFKISVKGNATLVFSFIGMKPQEVSVGNQTSFNITMEEDITQLAEIEIVDVGYGTMKRSDLTGSVASVSAETLQKIPVASAAEAITGRLPGVRVQTTDGSPDAEIVIRVRGGGSVTQDNSPLYVVDGFIMSSIRDIPPTDIASIDVLKDAAATAIYGASAANGVIIINTKKPKAGRVSVNYNGFAKYNELPQNRKYEVLSPYDYVMANYETAKLKSQQDVEKFEKYYGKYEDLELYKNKAGTDWQDELFGGGQLSQYHNVSLSGGSENTKISLSLTNNSEEGLISGSGYERNALNLKLSQNISDNLLFDFGTRVTYSITDGSGTSGSSQLRVKDAITTRPVNGIADELDIDLNSLDTNDDYQSFLLTLINPTELAEQDWRKRTDKNYAFNGGLSWNATNNLTFKTVVNGQSNYRENLRFYGPLTGESQKEGSSLPLGTIEERNSWSYRWYNTVGYSFKDLGRHKLDLLVGQEINSNGGESSFVRQEEFRVSITPEEMFANMQLGKGELRYQTAEATEDNKFSLFGRVNYQWDDRFMLTATFRRDANSKFAKDKRVGFFPAVAVGWKLSEEAFMSNVNFVDQLKLRLSYGEIGNDKVDRNASRFLFSAQENNGPGFGNGGSHLYYSPESKVLYNPFLIWETTISRNAGLDFSLFKARITGSFDAYYNTTTDLLLDKAIPPNSGFETQWDNIGSTSNRGIELGLEGYIIDNDEFSLSANINFGLNKGKIEELDGTNERFFQSDWASTSLKDRNDFLLRVGETIGLIYGYVHEGMYTVDDFEMDASSGEYVLKEGVVDNSSVLGVTSLRPGYMKIKDLDGDGDVDSDDRQVIGNALPKAQGGFGFNARYKGFDASIFFNWSYGNDIYNTGKIEFNQYYRTTYSNMLNTMNPDNRFTYIDVDGSYTGTPGEEVTDLEQLREMNAGKSMWSGNNSFGTATAVLTDWAVEDGSFIRLNTLTLGYTLPVELISKVKLSQVRIYATGYNLALWTNYSGYDPEVSTTRSSSYPALTPGVDYSAYPRSRSYTVGVNITF
ncbi:TonB-dependent receptor [Fulvivirga kasyanovii]|uniref:TonB-dependent receptor n=1 Tax=Fulvivirga kasyanovii TaxID=396812 RepID=A0ABW9RX50_9BACT|nr:TonB-dependent receptor [Fulvivirga kasyanovii]MTI28829.1 TonB-dependent receptor [Fulvivirga kasyanovii]